MSHNNEGWTSCEHCHKPFTSAAAEATVCPDCAAILGPLLSRRALLRGAGGVALVLVGAPALLAACSSATVTIPKASFLAYHDYNQTDHTKKANDLAAQGWRPISLSMYGDPADPRFAAVYLPSGPSWHGIFNYQFADAQTEYTTWQAKGFHPTIITALGAGAAARISVIFEQKAGSAPLTRWGMAWGSADQTPNLASPSTFLDYAAVARQQKLILTWITIYGAANARLYGGIWYPNPAGVRYNADASADDSATLDQRLDAQESQYARPSLISLSADQKYVAIFRDDPVDPNPLVKTDMSSADYQQQFNGLTALGWYPVAVQGGGVGAATRFSAIFVQQKQPLNVLARKWRDPTGYPSSTAIDNAMRSVMQSGPVRAAALAIVRDRKLVLARGYTYAEDSYPTTQPTTLFRLASCSKMITALAVWQLLHEGKLTLATTAQSVLGLTPPPGKAMTPGFSAITVQDLLEMRSGLPYEVAGRNQMMDAAGQLGASLPLTAAQVASYLSAQPLSSPGYGYNNSGYALLGDIVAKKRQPGTADLAQGYIQALKSSLMDPLHISHFGLSRTLKSDQPSGEARYDSSWAYTYTDANNKPVYRDIQDLLLEPSAMHTDGRLVPIQYGGWYNHEVLAGAGGLSMAMPDLARILAALNVKENNPILDWTNIQVWLRTARAANLAAKGLHGCHGWDAAAPISSGWYAQKGGDLMGAQSVVHFTSGDLCFAVAWAFDNVGGDWYPDFPEALSIASGANISSDDLFPQFGMPSFS